MTRISRKSRVYVAILALAIMTTTGGAQAKPLRIIWKGVEVFEGFDSWHGADTALISPADSKYVVVTNFTYIEETDFKTHGRVVSHKLSWHASGRHISYGRRETTCEGSGEVELVGLFDTKKALKIPCTTRILSNPNELLRMTGINGIPDSIGVPKIIEWSQLGDDLSYSEHQPGHSYSVRVFADLPCSEVNALSDPRLPPGMPKTGKPDIQAESTSIEPDGETTLKIKVTCDGQPVPNAAVDLTIRPKDGSGGHAHSNKRPAGALDGQELADDSETHTVWTGEDGSVKKPVKFEPPGKNGLSRGVGIAGLYEVKAASQLLPELADTVSIKVANTKLKAVPANDHYQLVRGGADSHPDGTYGTEPTLRAFKDLAADFYHYQEENKERLKQCGKAPWPISKMSINDVALKEGGLFDFKSTWTPPHQTHGKGQGGDMNHFWTGEGVGKTYTGSKVVEDCYDFPHHLDRELEFILLELGEPAYGTWDAYDRTIGMLHLHVEDRRP